jgi:hypothetical protein
MNVNIRSGDVPVLIRKTAEEIAGCFFEMSRSDRFRAAAGTQKQFIKRHWKDHLSFALESLAGLLGQPGFPEDQKMTIHEAILEFHERAKPGTPSNLSLRNWQ